MNKFKINCKQIMNKLMFYETNVLVKMYKICHEWDPKFVYIDETKIRI